MICCFWANNQGYPFLVVQKQHDQTSKAIFSKIRKRHSYFLEACCNGVFDLRNVVVHRLLATRVFLFGLWNGTGWYTITLPLAS